MIRFMVLLLVFWGMQIFAALAFKYGSLEGSGKPRKTRWLGGFLSGNAVGMASMWLCMWLYVAMPSTPNVVAALAGGGAFVLSQVALAGVFKSRLNARQWTGIAVATAGLVLVGWGSITRL